MTTIPEVDLPIKDLIEGKKIVIYTASNKGEFPNTFMKTFIPSSITLNGTWYVGYTPMIIEGFNMIEIPDIIAKGLQSFNIVNHSFKRYNQYNEANKDNEKLEIIMSDEDIKNQIASKKVIINFELIRVYDKKIKELYIDYGREADTWITQLDEAKLFKSDSNASVPFIENLAKIREITVDELATKIIEKVASFNLTMSTMIGTKQKFSDKVKKANTNEELNDILNEINKM